MVTKQYFYRRISKTRTDLPPPVRYRFIVCVEWRETFWQSWGTNHRRPPHRCALFTNAALYLEITQSLNLMTLGGLMLPLKGESLMSRGRLGSRWTTSLEFWMR